MSPQCIPVYLWLLVAVHVHCRDSCVPALFIILYISLVHWRYMREWQSSTGHLLWNETCTFAVIDHGAWLDMTTGLPLIENWSWLRSQFYSTLLTCYLPKFDIKWYCTSLYRYRHCLMPALPVAQKPSHNPQCYVEWGELLLPHWTNHDYPET